MALAGTLGRAAGEIAGGFVPVPGASLAGGTLGEYLGNLLGEQISPQQASPQQPIQPEIMNRQQPAGNWFMGYEGQQQQLPRFDPQQQAALSSLLQQGLASLDPKNIEQLAMQRFEQQTVPSLAERFTSLGGRNRIASPAFASQIGAAGANLQSQLAGLRSVLGMQQLELGLQPSFENIYIPGQGGFGASAAEGVGQAATSLMPLFVEWLRQYMKQPQPMNREQIRQQNIQQGYQPVAPRQQAAIPSQYGSLPQLKGL
jgi:hypothetical protein